MNFLFCYLAVAVASQSQDSLGTSDLELKLDQYQNATGISEDKRNEIWNKTMENCKSNHILSIQIIFSVRRSDSRNSRELVMARYGISADLASSVSPVHMDIEYFNLEMMYQSGIFIIMDPGYYRFTLQCYHNQTGYSAGYAWMTAVRNSAGVMSTYCMWADNGNANGIFYLEAFDTVFVQKGGEKIKGGGYRNNFMIEKV